MLSNAFYIDANGNTYLYNSKGQMYKGCLLYTSGSSLKDLITSSLTDRTNNSKYGDTQANYIFARAHRCV